MVKILQTPADLKTFKTYITLYMLTFDELRDNLPPLSSLYFKNSQTKLLNVRFCLISKKIYFGPKKLYQLHFLLAVLKRKKEKKNKL
jgi:hypothetical protein